MADYTRMVSYMYQYEHGVKKKNVGYARIESKNGQCKFTLHMQLLGQIDSIFPTYLIRRDGKEMDLIYLGDSPLKSQMLDSRIMAEADNVADSGFGISDIGGMVIFLNNNLFYATEWDDQPIIASNVLAALRPKKHQTSNITVGKKERDSSEKKMVEVDHPTIDQDRSSVKENKEVNNATIDQDRSSVKENKEVNNATIDQERSSVIESKEVKNATIDQDHNVKKESKDDILRLHPTSEKEQVDVFDYVGNSGVKVSTEGLTLAQIEDKIPKYKLPRGYKTLEGLQRDHYIFVESAKKDIESIESGRNDMLAAATIHVTKREEISKTIEEKEVEAEVIGEAVAKPEVKVIEKAVNRPQVKVVERAVVKPEMKPVEKEIVKPVVESVEIVDQKPVEKKSVDHSHDGKVSMSQVTVEKEPLPEDKKENKMAKYFFDKYPKMYPFEDNEVTLCVKIEPKDIGFLPNEFWSLSNNSFLLHGYYSHRHLIFAQINTQKGIRYILGIPGTFQGKERHMAKMFGFENFKSVRKRELKQGDFGYWCKYIQV